MSRGLAGNPFALTEGPVGPEVEALRTASFDSATLRSGRTDPLSGRPSSQPSPGFSLLEILVTLLFLGVIIVPLFSMWSAGEEAMLDVDATAVASSLAQELVEEVQASVYCKAVLPLCAARFCDPDCLGSCVGLCGAGPCTFGPEAGETTDASCVTTPCRLGLDDLDDYDGWSESPPKSRDGTAFTKANGYPPVYEAMTRAATVVNVANAKDCATGTRRASFAAVCDGTTDFKRLTVTVSWTDHRGDARSLDVEHVFANTKLGGCTC